MEGGQNRRRQLCVQESDPAGSMKAHAFIKASITNYIMPLPLLICMTYRAYKRVSIEPLQFVAPSRLSSAIILLISRLAFRIL